MHDSESPDTSLQAILYINEAGAKRASARVRYRLPAMTVVVICAATAACAVAAVTYNVKHPIRAALAPTTPIRVTHQAAQVHVVAVRMPAPQAVRLVPPTRRRIATPQPIVLQKAPHSVAMRTPAAVVTPQAPRVLAQHLAAMHVHVHLHPHHVHRRIAALHVAALPAAVAYAPIAAPAGSDPIITRLIASPAAIPQGSGASVCVSARHASQLSISGVGEVNPLLLDCRHVSPTVTTTYTAWAVNNLGVTVSQNVTVTVTH